MKKINANVYTKGKFGKRPRKIIDTDNEYLYSNGRYPTKIKKEDLPEDYIEFKSRVIWYMTGYLKTSNVIDVKYMATKLNHLFKDDYLYISYKQKLKMEENSFGFNDYTNYDVCICGSSIIPILLSIQKHSKINIDEVKNQINDKVEWYRKKYKDDYIRQFGNRDIDIFEIYKNF